MFCTHCGAPMPANAAYCPFCGAPRANRAAANPATAPISTPAAPVPAITKPPFVPPAKGIAASCRETVQVPLTLAQIDQRMGTLPSRGVNFDYIGRNARPGRVEFLLAANMSFGSWGENIHVACTENASGCTVEVFSRCMFPIQLFDLGKNRRNVRTIIAFLNA